MTHSYSLHKISAWPDISFSADEYSRFKFGDETAAMNFGTHLAKGFIENAIQNIDLQKQIVVLPSPYSFIPTATYAMKTYFVFALNRWLAEHGHQVVQEAKVFRTITYKEDYGELDAAQRIKLIGNDSFQIDREFIAGKNLLFLDDIRITGSHEKMILKMIDHYGLTNDICMLYFAELINNSIHPNIENKLNYHSVKSIFDIDRLIKSGNFKFNTRVVKYLLNTEFSVFSIFLQDQADDFVGLLFDLAVGNSYHTIPAYSANFNFIKEHIFTNNLKAINHGN